MPHWHKILVIFMIYAILSRNLLWEFTHFFHRLKNRIPQTLSFFGCMLVTTSCANSMCFFSDLVRLVATIHIILLPQHVNYLYLCPFPPLFLRFTSSSSLKREELPTATDQKWLMRLRKDDKKMNPGETNEDCPGAVEEERNENAGLNTVNDETALTRLLKRDQHQWPPARKRTKSYLTRAGKRATANWKTGDKTFYLSRAGKRGTFYLTRAGKRNVSYLTRQATASPARAQRTDRSYLTRAGKRGTFYLTRAGKRSGFHRSEKKKDKSYLTRAGKRSKRQIEIVWRENRGLHPKARSIPKS